MAAFDKLLHKWETDSCMQKEKQYTKQKHRIYKIEKIKKKTNTKNIKTDKSSNYKMEKISK